VGATFIGILARRVGSWIGIAVLAGLAVISNVLASAKIVLFPFHLHAPAGIIAYAMSFFLMDILNEIYGKREAMKAALAGIIAQLATVPLIWLTLKWPAAPFMTPERIEATKITLGLSPRLFVTSVIAFTFASLLNIYLFNLLKKATHGTLLWLRNNVSTITAIFAANLIFIPLGYMNADVPILNMIKGHSLVQVMIALIDTLFIYLIVRLFKHRKIKLTFEDILLKVRKIDFDTVDLVVAVGKGGLVPGALIANLLHKKFSVIWLNYRDDKHIPQYEQPRLVNEIEFEYSNKSILLVDDVSRTGATLKKAKEILNTKVKTCVINGKADYSLYVPEFT
jgi:uncharacterized integral membrane protein (TIGR00697 family)